MKSKDKNDLKKVLVVGPGAVGTTLAASLTRAGFDPILLGRRSHAVASEASRVWRSSTEQYRWPVHTELATIDLSEVQGCVLAVKAFDLAAAMQRVLPALPGETPLLLAINGAVDQWLRQQVDAERWSRVRLTATRFGTAWHPDGYFEWRSPAGRCDFGPLIEGSQPTAWERQWAGDELMTWCDNIWPAYRQKWLGNVVINTLTARFDLAQNGDLMNHRDAVNQRIVEAIALGESLWGPWPKAATAHAAQVWQLIEQTAANENSMRRDRQTGRQLELDLLSGLTRSNASRYPLLWQDDQELLQLQP